MRGLIWACVAALVLSAGHSKAAPPIEAYGHLPSVEQMTLSSNGDRVAFVGVSGDARKIFVRQIGGPMLVAAPIGDSKVRQLIWAGEDHLIILSTETATASGAEDEKGEYTTLVVADLKNHRMTVPLKDTNFFPGVAGMNGVRKIGDRWYAFMGLEVVPTGRLKSEDSVGYQRWADLYKMDLDTFETTLVAHGNRFGREWVLDAAGNVAATEEYSSETGESRVFAGNGERLIAHVKSDSNAVGIAGLGRTDDTVLVTGLNGEGKNAQEVSLRSGAVSDIFPDTGRDVGTWHSPVTHRLIGYSVAGVKPHVVLFDAAQDALLQRAVRPFDDARVNIIDLDDGFDRLLIHTEGDTDSGSYYLIDIKARKADPLGYDYPAVGGHDVGARRVVKYHAQDGTALEAILTLPPGRPARGLPVVVLPHGGPRAHDSIPFDWWSEAFASRGYAVIQPNFRGSTGYGQGLLKAGYGQWGRKMQTDVTDALKAVADEGIVDPKRACIVGASYGGYAALAAVTVQHGFYRCAVSVAGVSDLNAMLDWVLSRAGYEDNSASRYWNVAMGARDAGDPALHDVSPARLAAGADAPVLLIYGKDDTVVPNDQSLRMQRALKAAGKPVETVIMDKEDHWLSREGSRIQMLKAADEFVERHNPPDLKPVVTVDRVVGQ